jgi:hypothetical protein
MKKEKKNTQPHKLQNPLPAHFCSLFRTPPFCCFLCHAFCTTPQQHFIFSTENNLSFKVQLKK